MTLGDVLAVVAGLLAFVATWTAILLATALLFPATTARAQQRVQAKPWRSFFLGVAVCLIGGGTAVALLNLPDPGAKVLGWVLFGLLWGCLLLGAAGIAQLLGARIRAQSPGLSPFAGLVYGSLILGVAQLFPGIGWFFLAPLAWLCALGAGVAALWPGRKNQADTAPLLLREAASSLEEAGVGR